LFADDVADAAERQHVEPAPDPDGHAVGWARDTVARAVSDGLGVVQAATRPAATVRGAVRSARRVICATRDEVLPRAPDSPVNVPIGGRRSLVGYHAGRAEVRAARAA